MQKQQERRRKVFEYVVLQLFFLEVMDAKDFR